MWLSNVSQGKPNAVRWLKTLSGGEKMVGETL